MGPAVQQHRPGLDHRDVSLGRRRQRRRVDSAARDGARFLGRHSPVGDLHRPHHRLAPLDLRHGQRDLHGRRRQRHLRRRRLDVQGGGYTPDNSYSDNLITAASPYPQTGPIGNRNGNLTLTQYYYGAIQPSTQAAPGDLIYGGAHEVARRRRIRRPSPPATPGRPPPRPSRRTPPTPATATACRPTPPARGPCTGSFPSARRAPTSSRSSRTARAPSSAGRSASPPAQATPSGKAGRRMAA